MYPKLQSTGNWKKPFEKEVLEDFTVELTNGDFITIEKGFKTDLASVPRQLILVLSMLCFTFSVQMAHIGQTVWAGILLIFGAFLGLGLYNTGRAMMDEVAPTVHDWLFQNKKHHRYSRAFCDEQLYFYMKLYEFNPIRPPLYFLGVCAFSWFFWYDIPEKIKKALNG